LRLVPLLAARALFHRAARTLFAAAGVALGIATVTAILVLDETTVERERERRTSDYAQPDLEVVAREEGADPRGRLLEAPGVVGVCGVLLETALATAEGRELGPLSLVALDASARPLFDAYRIETGADLALSGDAAGASPVLVGERLASEAKLGVGSRLTLRRRPAEALTGCFDGEIRPRPGAAPPVPPVPRAFVVTGILAHERLGRRDGGRVAVVPFPEGRRLFEGAFVAPRFWVKKAPGVSAEALASALAGGFAVASGRSAAVGENADERAFRNGVRLAGMLALVLGLFVIFHTLTTSLVERVHSLAGLHALGATRGQLALAFLLEASFIAATGAAAGLVAGLGLAKLLLSQGVTTLGLRSPVAQLSVPWGPVLAVTVLGAAVALAGAAFPLLRMRSLPTTKVLVARDLTRTTDVFRGLNRFALVVFVGVLPFLYVALTPVLEEAEGRTLGVLGKGLAIFGLGLGFPLVAPTALSPLQRRIASALRRRWPFEGLLAARSLEGASARVVASIAALGLVGGSLFAMKAMTASLRGETREWAAAALEGKLFASIEPPIPYARLREIVEASPQFLGIEPASVTRHTPFLIRSVRPEDLGPDDAFGDDDEARRSFAEGGGLIVSMRLAASRGLAPGTQVTIPTEAGLRFLPVLAISDRHGFYPAPSERAYGVIAEGTMKRFFCVENDPVGDFALRCAPGTDLGEASRALVDAIGPDVKASVRTGSEVLDFELRDLTRDFFLFDIIFGLVAALAGLGLLNALLVAGLERSKELGVLRALGMTGGQLARSIALEAGTTGLLGGAAAALLGLPFAAVVVEGLRAISGLDLPYRFPPVWIAATLLGAAALSLVASVYPVWRLRRLSVVEAIRYE
jgi:putative ABC transport system permease protein